MSTTPSSQETRDDGEGFFNDAHLIDASHSEFTSIRGNQYIHNTYSAQQESVLVALNPVDRTVYHVTPCMEGTRRWIIEKICSWLDDDRASNILWLRGSPGVGKSTIASTLVSYLAEIGRLGSYFFCKRDDVALSDPATFWRTVAFDLARRDRVIANKMVENLQAGRVDPGRADIE